MSFVYIYSKLGDNTANPDTVLVRQIEIVAQSGTNVGVAENAELFETADGEYYRMASATGGAGKPFYQVRSIILKDGTLVSTASVNLNYQIFNLRPVDSSGVATGDPNISIISFTPGLQFTTTRSYQVTSPDGTRTTISTTLEQLIAQYGGIRQFDTSPSAPGTAANWLLGDDALGVVCFAKGTMIATERGEVAVETLSCGDLVLTRDHGFQPINWIGTRTIPLSSSEGVSRFHPIRIEVGALGNGLPQKPLYVSQQHRILVRSKIAQRMFGVDEVLVPAKRLLEIEGISLVSDRSEVTYVHFLFEQHQVIYSNGAQTESLFTGPEVLKAVDEAARAEIIALFPELGEGNYLAQSVRVIPDGKFSKKLVRRHAKNSQALYESIVR